MRSALLFALLLLFVPVLGHAQGPDWTPPSREMPMMPRAAELAGDWLSGRAAWFRGVDGISGVTTSGLRASGDPRSGSEYLQVARFTHGPYPVVVWSDRNADSRADIIEIFKSGGVIIQLIDADYDGSANVIRVYDASGALLRQDRM